jgi:hypothetical protein
MKKLSLVLAGLLISASGAFAQNGPHYTPMSKIPGAIVVAQGASSCSGWQSICESRGPGCDAKFKQCMKSGCWTEGAKYGGGTHCGLAKR